MENVFVHPQGLLESSQVGPRTRIWAFSHVMAGAALGADCNVGECVFIESGAVLGNRVVVKNGVQIWSGVVCEDDVFLGPNATLTNDLRPRAKRHDPTHQKNILLEKGSSVGANATIVAGVKIGTYAMIGAGAVVIRDVPAYALCVGNPARQIGWVCSCGERLSAHADDFICALCGKIYKPHSKGLKEQRKS